MARLVWTLPDGFQTARWAEDEGGSGSQVVLSSDVTLTAAQIKDLHTTYVPIVAAPGVGLVVVGLNATFTYHAGGTPFTSPGSSIVGIGTAADVAGFGTTFEIGTAGNQNMLVEATDKIAIASATPMSGMADPAALDNEPWVIGNPASDWEDGDGTLEIDLVYYLAEIG